MKFKSSPGQKPRPPVLRLSVLNMGMISQVSASDPCYHGRYSSPPISPLEENAGDMREEGGELVASRGTCRYHRVVRSLLTSTSLGDRRRGHCAWGFPRPQRPPKGGRRWIRISQNRLGGHLHRLPKLPSSLMSPFSKYSSDERICRKPSPSESRSMTSSHV